MRHTVWLHRKGERFRLRVVLIHPRTIDIPQPPLGLLYIGAVLEKEGHDVRIFDPWPNDDRFLERVGIFRPDLVGLSLLTPQYSRALSIVRTLKGTLPEAKYCAGGVHTTALPVQTLREFDLDFVIFGEGELTMKEVCERLEAGRDLNNVKGVGFKNDQGEVVVNQPRELIRNLDELPFPARHLLDFEWYLIPPGPIRGFFLRKSAVVMASRGCTAGCIYCGSHLIFGRKVRYRSVGNLIAEITHLIEDYAIDGLWFTDDELTVNNRWVMDFCRELKTQGISLKWGCQSRVDTVSEELLLEMKRAGCVQLDYGVESGSERVLKTLKKNITPEEVRAAFAMTKRLGLRAMASFMIGNPGETYQDIKKTLELASQISADFTRFFYTTPYPGTELYDMAKRERWIDPDLRFSELWSVRQAEYPVMTAGFTRVELARIRARLQNKFLLRNYSSYAKRPSFTLRFLSALLQHPRALLQGVVRSLRTRRLDDAAESALWQYRVKKFGDYQRERGKNADI